MHQHKTALTLIGILCNVFSNFRLAFEKTSYTGYQKRGITSCDERIKPVIFREVSSRPSLSQLNKLLMSSSREITVSMVAVPLESQLRLPFSCRTYLISPCLSLQHLAMLNYIILKLQIQIIQLKALSLPVFSSAWHIST